MALTAMVAIAFLIPLALLVQQLAHERALAQAERQTAIVVSVLTVTTDARMVAEVMASISEGSVDQLAIHGLGEDTIGASHAAERDVALATERQQTLEAPAPGGLAYLEPVEIGPGRTAVIEVFVPDAELSAGVRGAWVALATVAAGLVIGAGVVGDRLAARVVRPARRLAVAATAVGGGDLDVRVEPSGPRELAEAAMAFNRMADRLAQLRTAEREMVADLSHRLRTPLTGLRLDVETLDAEAPHSEAREMEALAMDVQPGNAPPGELSRAEARDADAQHAETQHAETQHAETQHAETRDPESPDTDTGALRANSRQAADRRRTVTRVRQAIATLEREVDVLIRTTRQAADQAPAVTPGRCDAGEVVRERMVFWSAVAADQERACRVLAPPGRAPVPVAATELAAALDAVLGNAFRYTPQGTTVEVAVSRREGWVAVRVDDAGPGIADPDLALRRGASGRGSTGLGLDIARRVAEAAGGSVNVDRARLGGASVVMLLADAEVAPRQPNRLGLIGRLTREPRTRGRPRQGRSRPETSGAR